VGTEQRKVYQGLGSSLQRWLELGPCCATCPSAVTELAVSRSFIRDVSDPLFHDFCINNSNNNNNKVASFYGKVVPAFVFASCGVWDVLPMFRRKL
jgi:hypothetical protein